jgi:ATP-dependent Clp protease ATP-binding subunit ClpC
MYQKFDAVTKTVLASAEEETIRLSHSLISPVHIMLALLKSRCNAVTLMAQMLRTGDAENIRLEIERQIGTGPEQRIGGPITLSDRAREVIRLAGLEVIALGDSELATQHILLGLLRVNGVVSSVLGKYGISVDSLREQMKRLEV